MRAYEFSYEEFLGTKQFVKSSSPEVMDSLNAYLESFSLPSYFVDGNVCSDKSVQSKIGKFVDSSYECRSPDTYIGDSAVLQKIEEGDVLEKISEGVIAWDYMHVMYVRKRGEFLEKSEDGTTDLILWDDTMVSKLLGCGF